MTEQAKVPDVVDTPETVTTGDGQTLVVRRFGNAAVNEMVDRAVASLREQGKDHRVVFTITGEVDDTGVQVAAALILGGKWSASGYVRKQHDGKQVIGGQVGLSL